MGRRQIQIVGILLGSLVCTGFARAQTRPLESPALTAVANADAQPSPSPRLFDLSAQVREQEQDDSDLPNQWLWDALGAAANEASPKHRVSSVTGRIAPTVSIGLGDRVAGLGVVGEF